MISKKYVWNVILSYIMFVKIVKQLLPIIIS